MAAGNCKERPAVGKDPQSSSLVFNQFVKWSRVPSYIPEGIGKIPCHVRKPGVVGAEASIAPQ